jgi:hypothetical protein
MGAPGPDLADLLARDGCAEDGIDDELVWRRIDPDLLLNAKVGKIPIAHWLMMCARGVLAVQRCSVIMMFGMCKVARHSAVAPRPPVTRR